MTHLALVPAPASAATVAPVAPVTAALAPASSLPMAGCVPFEDAGELTQLAAYYEEDRKIVWMMMQAKPRPSFNETLLREIIRMHEALKVTTLPVEFHVLGSTGKDMFNVGGDLAHFAECIRSGKREQLLTYARLCVDAIYTVYTGHDRDIITLAMVDGTALGGGFEAALANHFVLARSDARMGFPEIAFNLFPGMGAYSFVTRRSGSVLAEKLILTGEAHTGEWHHERGLVDATFEPGEALRATRGFIDTLRPKLNGVRAMIRTRKKVVPVPYEELMAITEDWVDSAFKIEPKDLAYMERLVMLQSKRSR